MFYARPAYRSAKKEPLRNLNFAPVAFLVDPLAASARSPVEVFPFDTGALQNGHLSEDVHPTLSPFDFALEPSIDSAQKLAHMFFGGDRNYFKAAANASPPPHSPTDADVVAYCSLISRGSNYKNDERCTSIEIQFKDAVEISGKILAIILPQDFFDDPEIKSSIASMGVEAIPYEFLPDHKAAEYVGAFYREAAHFYERHKTARGWEW